MCFAFLGLAGSWQNVALHTNGSTCTASSSDVGQPCLRAIDGLLWYYRAWVSRRAGVGIWIEVWIILCQYKMATQMGPLFQQKLTVCISWINYYIIGSRRAVIVIKIQLSAEVIARLIYKPWFCEILFIIYCSTPQQIFTNSLFAHVQPPVSERTSVAKKYWKIMYISYICCTWINVKTNRDVAFGMGSPATVRKVDGAYVYTH